jgi:hypothetical protein
MRRKANRDKGEAAIVAVLREVGASVEFLDLKDGPDLAVGFRGRNYLLEVKDELGPRGGSSRDGQQLGEGQARWHPSWRGSVDVVRSPRDALLAIHAIERGEISTS